MPTPSRRRISIFLELLVPWGKSLDIVMLLLVAFVGVNGGEVRGPTVLPVPVLFVGPEEVGCFLFLMFYIAENHKNT